MKRLKSTLATILLIGAGAAAVGLGAAIAIAAFPIGLAGLAAARLIMGTRPRAETTGPDIVDGEPAAA